MDELMEMRDEIENSLVIFVVATYGEGDPTDNTIPLYEWLKDGPDLSGLNFTVFALGNKTYEHYQGFGRYIDKRVEELGGNRLFERGEGDDDGNIEEDFMLWRERFWVSMCNFYGVRQDTRKLSECISRDFELKVIFANIFICVNIFLKSLHAMGCKFVPGSCLILERIAHFLHGKRETIRMN